MVDELQARLADALELSRIAKARFLARPILHPKRARAHASPWFVVWNESTQNAVRLAREIRQQGGTTSPSLDEELEELFGDQGKGREERH